MHLTGLRVHEVGLFQNAVAVDGLGPGLNVLAAPNESGKSTLMRAVDRVFRYPHASMSRDIKALQPKRGGAPWITCEFVIDGVAWRLTRQYLAQRSSELRRADGGEVVRGDDVAQRLANLLGSGPAGRATYQSLLWVGQGDATDWHDPKKDNERLGLLSLREVVSSEIDAATRGGQAERILQGVRDTLSQLVTGKRQTPKANGRYARALAERDRLQAGLDDLLARQKNARANLEEAARLETEIAALADPEQDAEAARRIASLQKHRARAGEAQSAFEKSQAEERSASQQLKLEEGRIREIDQWLKDHADLQAVEAELTQLGDQETVLSERVDVCATVLRQRTADLEALEALRAEQAARERLEQCENRYQRLSARHTALADLDAEIARLHSQSQRGRVTHVAMENLEDCERLRQRAADRLEDAAPVVQVHYEPGHHQAFQVNGRSLAEGQSVTVSGDTTIVVPGVGALNVAAGHGIHLAQLAGQANEAAQRLRLALDALGVAGLEEARVARDHLAAIEQELQEAVARRDVLLPEGGRTEIEARLREALRARDDAQAARDAAVHRVAKHRGQARNSAPIKPEPHVTAPSVFEPDGSDPDVLGDVDAVAHARLALEAARTDEAAAKSDLVTLKARRDGLRQQLNRLKMRIDASEITHSGSVAKDLRDQALTAKHVAQAAYDDALQRLESWKRQVLELGAPDQFDTQIASLETERADRRRRLDAARGDLRELQGAIASYKQEGIGAQCDSAREALDAAQHKVEDIERDVDALRLLANELEARAAVRRSSQVAPIAHRLSGLTQDVFGASLVGLDDDFGGVTVARGDTEFAITDLSGGAREQIAVLARVAFAGVLADHGAAMPLVLDDALVYADDARLGRLFATLARAAQRHQVIVLTCHQTMFRPLVESYGAKILRIVPDDPALVRRSA